VFLEILYYRNRWEIFLLVITISKFIEM
jgi:hypothetical protein